MKIEYVKHGLWNIYALINDEWTFLFSATNCKDAARLAEKWYAVVGPGKEKKKDGSLDSLLDIFLGDSYK